MVEYLAAPAAERAVAEKSGSGAAVARRRFAPLMPVSQAIDFEHLARMTFGEHDLERDVLTLFDVQAAMLLGRMDGSPPQAVAVFAHTLNGSARGIGAWKVSEAAEALERDASGPEPAVTNDAIGRLSLAVAEARAAIAQVLHAP
jgi:hypothetical protein